MRLPSIVIAAMLLVAAHAAAKPIGIVAVENFYGDVARQIGGPDVEVSSILANPDTDPHLFEASPSTARAVAGAAIVIENGLDYDPWIAKLLRASGDVHRREINVADLLGKKPGDNPHIWYDPKTMPAVARALADALDEIDPARRAEHQERLRGFLASMQPIDAKIAALRTRLADMPVAATEPVFGYMLAALGAKMANAAFQRAVMNSTEPSASAIAAFEDSLRNRRVRLLIYNSQAADPAARRMLEIAKAAEIPVVPVTETEPPGTTYQAWIAGELDAIDRALPRPGR